MNTYLLIPLVEVVLCLTLLALVMISGQRHVARKTFLIFLIFMCLWGVFILAMRASDSLEQALMWEKLVFLAILSAAFFFYRFTAMLTGTEQKKGVVYAVYGSYLLFLGMVPTQLVVKGMQAMWYGKAPVIGPLFFPYVLCVYVPIVMGLAMLIRHRRQSKVIDERVRDQYIICGIIAMFIGGTTDYLPSIGLGIYPLGIVGNILFCLLASVAMLRHNLLDTRAVLRKGTAYSLVSMILLGIFVSLIFFLSNVFKEMFSPLSLTVTVITVFAVAAVFQPVLNRIQRFVDRIFFRERYDHIQALMRFTTEKKSNLNLEQLCSSLVAMVANSTGSKRVQLLLPSPSGAYDNFSACRLFNNGRISLASSSPLIATMKYNDSLIDVNDMEIIPSLHGLAQSEQRILTNHYVELLLPLKNSGRLAGIMLLSSKASGEPYSHEERQLLRSVSDAVAADIENASRYEQMRIEHGEMQKAVDGVIHAVSLVIETRDPYTAGHQHRVAELAKAIAREMKLPEWNITGIYIAGLLHDVGKIAVPVEILSKPGRLSQYEFSLIKDHPRVGYEILEKIEFPWPVTKSILQHHERMNGSGYPNATSGENIIMDARILGVADVVEAMASHRPYRPALGVENALEEIIRQKGILYDEEVVDACLKLFKNGEFDFDKLPAGRDYAATAQKAR